MSAVDAITTLNEPLPPSDVECCHLRFFLTTRQVIDSGHPALNDEERSFDGPG